MQRLFFLFGATMFVLFTGSHPILAQTPAKNPFAGDAKAIAEGKGIFEGVCAGYCHATETTTRPVRLPVSTSYASIQLRTPYSPPAIPMMTLFLTTSGAAVEL